MWCAAGKLHLNQAWDFSKNAWQTMARYLENCEKLLKINLLKELAALI